MLVTLLPYYEPLPSNKAQFLLVCVLAISLPFPPLPLNILHFPATYGNIDIKHCTPLSDIYERNQCFISRNALSRRCISGIVTMVFFTPTYYKKSPVHS